MENTSPILYEEEIYDSKSKTTRKETRITGIQRYYIKATAELYDLEQEGKVSASAFAREDENKKGHGSEPTNRKHNHHTHENML